MIRPRRFAKAWIACSIASMALLSGCTEEKPPTPQPRYETHPAKVNVPSFMQGTIWERTELGNTEPFQISSFGLVVNLDNTGDTTAPYAVKSYVMKEMVKHQMGSALNPEWRNMPPDRVLNDRRVAIVQVVGMVPPGIRKGQMFDVVVQSLSKNQTTSLAGGELYTTDLKINGADPSNPFDKVNYYAVAKGVIFVNPAYALNKEAKPPKNVRQSLRNGVIMDGAMARYDRPLFLRLLTPEARVSRSIEQRIIDRFSDKTVAAAEDEGIIQLFVPFDYNGDWQHFAKLVEHVYINASPELLSAKARNLAVEAQKPNAKLEDISYCWEGIGTSALPFITPLLGDARPGVAFAAARAAAFIGDSTGTAQNALMAIARDSNHPYQLKAIETLGALPASTAVNAMLRGLLDSDRTLVRIQAYQVLARNGASFIESHVVTENPNHQKFVLDLVPSNGPPIVYATRTGTPRIAIIGAMPEILTPVMFTAMDDRLMISSSNVGQALTIFYRAPAAADTANHFHDAQMSEPIKMGSRPDLLEVVQRLGGVTAEGEVPLDFSYSEVVAILSRLNDQKKLVTLPSDGSIVQASFVLQDPPAVQNVIYQAPSIDTGRPQGDAIQPIGPGNMPTQDAALVAGAKKE